MIGWHIVCARVFCLRFGQDIGKRPSTQFPYPFLRPVLAKRSLDKAPFNGIYAKCMCVVNHVVCPCWRMQRRYSL